MFLFDVMVLQREKLSFNNYYVVVSPVQPTLYLTVGGKTS